VSADDFYGLCDDEQAAALRLLAHAAAEHWDGGFTNLKLVKYRENAVFSAERADGQRIAVRIHRHGYHSDAALLSELHWMKALDGSVEVPPVICTANGELLAHVDHPAVPEPRQVSILGWLTGTPVGTSEEGLELDDALAMSLYHEAGRLAATLHTQSAAMALPDGFTRHAWDDDGLIGPEPLWGRFWDSPTLTAPQRDLLQEAQSCARVDLENFGKTDRNYGLIHADFVPENLLNEAGRLKLIDFDDAGYGWHMFELATALYFSIEEPRYRDITAALVAGYRSVRPLPDADEARLPLFLFLRGTTYLGWIHSRPETETAKTMGSLLVDRACMSAQHYLATRT
jgi:Ser/Thr protein kinase RdoA (MazF antagonist)